MPQAMDVLLDVELPVTIRLGSVQVILGDVMALNAGSLVEFDRAADELVEVLVNNRVVARGEIVTVQGNYGVRITEVTSRSEHPAAVSPEGPETAGEF